jgi:hypothetical protein
MSQPSVYDDVKHIMIPLREISPEQQAWIAHVTELVAAFTEEVDFEDEDSHAINSFVIHTAAELLWQEQGGPRPEWGRLRVSQYLAHHGVPSSGDDDMQACLIGTLMAFYTFLTKHGHVSRGKAAKVMRKLSRYINHRLRQVIEQVRGDLAGDKPN